jgi:hypothetical protein
VLRRYDDSTVAHTLSAIFAADGSGSKIDRRAWYRSSSKRAQLVVFVIGSQEREKLGAAILSELQRGVTRFEATGMYTGKPHAVLLVALTVTEVNHLKSLMSNVEPQAFVIVMPTQEVSERGFQPPHTEASSK